MARLLATPQFSRIVYYLTVTLGSFLMDPLQGNVRLMERGVVFQPYVLVGLRQQLCRTHLSLARSDTDTTPHSSRHMVVHPQTKADRELASRSSNRT